MENNVVEELLNELFNLIQDAKSLPLSQDKCILEREHALDLLEEIMNKWPAEVKNAQAIIASRTDLIAQARREAEGIIRSAKENADKLVTEEAIYQETRRRCEEMVNKTKDEMSRIQQAGYQFLADSLKETEQAVSSSLASVENARMKFEALMEKNSNN